MRVENAELRDFLVDSDLISGGEFEVAAREAAQKNISVLDVLVSAGKISEDDARRLQAYLLGIPFIDLTNREIPYEVLSLVPEPLVRAYNLISFARVEHSLEVALLDIGDLPALEFLRKKHGFKILPRLTGRDSLKSAHLQYQRALQRKFGDLIRQESAVLMGAVPVAGGGESGAPGEKLLQAILRHALAQRASDVYLEPAEKDLLVRYRLGGLLHEAMSLPREVSEILSAKVRELAGFGPEKPKLPERGNFTLELAGEKIYTRVSLVPTIFGEKIVLNLKRRGSLGLSLEILGFEGEALRRMQEEAQKNSGLVLVAGPTGSGVTTTLYALLDLLNTPENSLSTIEKPVEYQMPRVSQTQVDESVGLSFPRGLRAVLEQEPDVVMVGALVDKETANLSLEAAHLGRKVLSGVEADSVGGALKHFSDFKVNFSTLASSLSLIIVQRLARRLCAGAEAYRLSKEEIKDLSKRANLQTVLAYLKRERVVPPEASWESIYFYRPKMSLGCEDGYRGRVAVFEVLPISLSLRTLLSAPFSAEAMEREARAQGAFSLFENGLLKAVRGETSLEEVKRVTSEVN